MKTKNDGLLAEKGELLVFGIGTDPHDGTSVPFTALVDLPVSLLQDYADWLMTDVVEGNENARREGDLRARALGASSVAGEEPDIEMAGHFHWHPQAAGFIPWLRERGFVEQQPARLVRIFTSTVSEFATSLRARDTRGEYVSIDAGPRDGPPAPRR